MADEIGRSAVFIDWAATCSALACSSVSIRVQCTHCHHEHLVAFNCKRRGFCPSCGARRMAESAALLVDQAMTWADA